MTRATSAQFFSARLNEMAHQISALLRSVVKLISVPLLMIACLLPQRGQAETLAALESDSDVQAAFSRCGFVVTLLSRNVASV